mgnify:FL=1
MLSVTTSAPTVATSRTPARLTILIPFLGIFLAGIFLQDLVLFAISTNPILNLMIISLGVYAGLLAFMRAVEVDRDQAIIAKLETLSSAHDLPSDRARRSSAVVHAFRSIQRAAETEGLRGYKDAVEQECAGMRSTYQQRVALLQYMTGLLISLGLLGTFLGLLQTLISSSGILDAVSTNTSAGAGGDSTEQFANMIAALKAPLADMGTAFSSSLFGLLGSIMVGVMVLLLQRNGVANVTNFRAQMQGSQARLFSFKQNETVDAEVVQDILAAMLERERLTHGRSEKILESFASSLRAIGTMSTGMERIAGTLDGMAVQIAVLPAWCEQSRETAGKLQAVGEGLGRIDARLEQIGQNVVAAKDRLADQGEAVVVELRGIGAGLQEQAKDSRATVAHLGAVEAQVGAVLTQVVGLHDQSVQGQSTMVALTASLTGVSEAVGAIRVQGERGLGILDGLGGELRVQSRLGEEVVTQLGASEGRLRDMSVDLGQLVTVAGQTNGLAGSLHTDVARICDLVSMLRTDAAALEPISRATSTAVGQLTELATAQQGMRQGFEAFREDLSQTAVQALREVESVAGVLNQLLTLTDQSYEDGRSQLRQFLEALNRLEEIQGQHQAAGQRASQTLTAMTGQMQGIAGHLSEVASSIPTQQRHLSQIEGMLEPLKGFGTMAQEQLGGIDRLVERFARLEVLQQSSQSALGEMTTGQVGQTQLLARLLAAITARGDHDGHMSSALERSADTLERLETVLQGLPRTDLMVEQGGVLSARLLALSDQVTALLRAQTDLRGEAQRTTDLLQKAAVENRSTEEKRYESLRQIFVAMSKIADVLEKGTTSETTQKEALRELDRSIRAVDAGLKDLAIVLKTERDTELSRVKTVVGRMEERIRDLADKFEKWRKPD